jgi:hypothetical protein
VIDNTATRNWDEQVFNAINGYPACGTFHQQRLYLAGTPEIPSGLWGSAIGDFFNFGLGTALDRDGIFINVGQENGVSVRHLVSGKHLQIFTEVGEFYVPRQDGQPITPLTITVDKQTPFGSLDVQPVSLDGATIFLQKSKTAVREFIYSEAERSYNANPLSLAASHMLKTPRDMAVLYGTSTRPEQYAFLVNTDGSMAVFYSARVERLAGWARWTLGSGAQVHLGGGGQRQAVRVRAALREPTTSRRWRPRPSSPSTGRRTSPMRASNRCGRWARATPTARCGCWRAMTTARSPGRSAPTW